MCLIAFFDKPDLTFTDTELDTIRHNNSDGMGIMYRSGGRVRVHRSLDEINIPNITPIAVHWRFATHGNVSKKGCHPHWIMSKDFGDPYDLALMHNGSMDYWDDLGALSDTAIFCKTVLRPILLADPEAYTSTEFWLHVVRESRDTGSKFILCHSEYGFTGVPNLGEWTNRNGILVSNTYSFAPPRHLSLKKRESKWSGNYSRAWEWDDDEAAEVVANALIVPEDPYSDWIDENGDVRAWWDREDPIDEPHCTAGADWSEDAEEIRRALLGR